MMPLKIFALLFVAALVLLYGLHRAYDELIVCRTLDWYQRPHGRTLPAPWYVKVFEWIAG